MTIYLLVAICLYLFWETVTFTDVLSMLLNYSFENDEVERTMAVVKRTMGNICLDPKSCNCINF